MLEAIKEQFDEHSDSYKAELLDEMSAARFRTAPQLERFHELLCIMRAYPDGPRVLKRSALALDAFDCRSDLEKLV